MADTGVERDFFEVAVEEAVIDHVQDRLDAFLDRDPTVADTDRTRFEMALVEIVGNIVEHAFAADADEGGRRLSVDLRLAPDRIEATLADNGVPHELDLGSVTMPDTDAVSGRGLALAVAAVDDLSYERVDGRNHWGLLCRRAGG
ncbi:ATP-binding protein [Nocardioides KLBMP 9356]|uniref:ATP-binding protein n=1 Tax=Nocardioides potassii TaxID=2911371 RepID=A0ABS9H5D9_9ACTN|nr:ATP-binding protein [Nocardioides potassii]MCF6376470.1 ATP-binding protein [Nocardioides potassii]